jgi:hypothetical protein
VSLSLIAGPVFGYRGDHEHKIPVDHNGLGAIVVPALGHQYGSVNSQLVFLGTSGIALAFSYDFWK